MTTLPDIQTSLLFAAIYDTARTKDFHFGGRPDAMPAEEFVDADDDAASTAAKRAANAVHLAWVPEWLPPTLDERPASLRTAYDRLFNQLLDDGADWHCENADAQTLLHVAVDRNHVPIVGQLLAHGLDRSATDAHGYTPMAYARSAAIVELLPAADVRRVSNVTRLTPLTKYLTDNPYVQDEHTVAAFISAGADVNARHPTDGQTALHLVSTVAVARRLLRTGADVNAPNAGGQTPVLVAADNDELLRLYAAQPDVNVRLRCAAGRTVLKALVERLTVDELASAVPQAADEAQLAQLFRELDGNVMALNCIRHWAGGPDALRHLPELLEDAAFDMHGVQCTYDRSSWALEAGAHVSQRTDKRPLRWPQPLPGNLIDALDWLVAHGCNLEWQQRDGELTVLQLAGDRQADVWTQSRRLGELIAAGAEYRLGVDGRRALDGTVFEFLYEWDAER